MTIQRGLEKGRATDSEDILLQDRSDKSDGYPGDVRRPLWISRGGRGSGSGTSGYKKISYSTFGSKIGREAISASQIPPWSTSPDDNGPLVEAMVIHGVPFQRPMAETIQEVGVKGIMGSRWLWGGM